MSVLLCVQQRTALDSGLDFTRPSASELGEVTMPLLWSTFGYWLHFIGFIPSILPAM